MRTSIPCTNRESPEQWHSLSSGEELAFWTIARPLSPAPAKLPIFPLLPDTASGSLDDLGGHFGAGAAGSTLEEVLDRAKGCGDSMGSALRGGIIDSLSAGDHERAKASALLALASLDPWFSRLRQGTRLRTLLHVLAILPLLGLSARVDEQLRV
ncbi:hypothetical protein AK812_SmicGene18392 [Symbiodinium microadriaticum]|uniref:Uncharacterized protein n=1 Tax=Symbiodinium microadriaticum TaxID=2951 RepID=A0A1Q9DV98_SYMMI|nr:hypothetical protein AK812_SmicGene18392 [Symbiodinium microadriaticum]